MCLLGPQVWLPVRARLRTQQALFSPVASDREAETEEGCPGRDLVASQVISPAVNPHTASVQGLLNPWKFPS